MRKLAWFSGGFSAACLLCCYALGGVIPLLAVLLLLVFAIAVERFTRPRGMESRDLSLLPRRRGIALQLSRRAVALCLGAGLAFLWFSVYSALFYSPAAEMAGTEQTISGEVSSYPEETSIGGWSMTVRLDNGSCSPDVLLYGSEAWGDLRPGDRVTCTARLKSSEFLYGDETTYYTARGVFLLAYCNEAPVVERAGTIPFRYWPLRCAKALETGIYAAFDSTAAPLAAAVTLGNKDGLDAQMYSALNRSGIMHAAVVSGMHISFLVSVILMLCGGRRHVALGLVPVLIFYAVMAGATPSAFRAVIMQTALLAGPVLGRENDAPSSLGLALLILLIQNPFSAASVSLQLSFASVAGILLASRRLSSAMLTAIRLPSGGKSFPHRMFKAGFRFLCTSLSVTLGAMLFTSPLIALYFRQVVLVSPLTNLLTLWAVTFLMIGALVIGAAAIPLPGIMAIPGAAVGLLGHYIQAVTSALGRWTLSGLSAEDPYVLLWLIAAYLFLLTIVLARRKGRQCLYSLGCLALLLGLCIGLNRLSARQSDLTVTALDVGQGACTLFLSDDTAVVVDCGGNSSSDPGDLAADRLASMGRSTLDALILTHLDSDHFNGVSQLFWRLEVKRVYLPESVSDPGNLAVLLELADREGAQIVFVNDTVSLPAGSAQLTLYPPLSGGTSNEEGLFVLCSSGTFDILITGDADSFTEGMLVKYCPIPDIELLMVGHHGSKHSTSQELLDAVRPELAVISVGYNSYGHPAEPVLTRLADAGVRVLRTDRSGSVTFKIRNGQVSIP